MTVLIKPLLRFSAEDIEAAHAAWGCNCGPAALATCCGLTLDEVRPHLGGFESRGFMNAQDMKAAIGSLNYWHHTHESPGDGLAFLTHGLARIQWGGPWTKAGANLKWASTHTHWVAEKWWHDEEWIFDINGGWMARSIWEVRIVPEITSTIKRADGTWFPTHRWEVRRS